MQVNPKLLKEKFEKSMPKYNENAFVQREMAELLLRILCEKVGCKFGHVLELGAGTGVLTEKLVQNLDIQRLTCNDIVEKSQIYLNKLGVNCDFIVGNSSKIKPSGKVDLIASNAMFQWFSNLALVLEHYARILNSGGVIAFSTFLEGNYKEIKKVGGVSLDYLPLEELKNIVSERFEILAMESYERTLAFASPLELLAHVKNTGVNSLSSSKLSFKEVKEFCQKISSPNGQCCLTYMPVLVVAKKK